MCNECAFTTNRSLILPHTIIIIVLPWLGVPTPPAEDHPTVRDCIMFQRLGKRTINIPQEIGSNYYQFGLLLLDDPNGTRVRNIERDYREIEQINTEILREWVTGRGKKPVTWETLTEVLRDIELGTLASEIEDIKLKSTTSTKL